MPGPCLLLSGQPVDPVELHRPDPFGPAPETWRDGDPARSGRAVARTGRGQLQRAGVDQAACVDFAVRAVVAVHGPTAVTEGRRALRSGQLGEQERTLPVRREPGRADHLEA